MYRTVEAANGVQIPQLGFGVYKIEKGAVFEKPSQRQFNRDIVILIQRKYTAMKKRWDENCKKRSSTRRVVHYFQGMDNRSWISRNEEGV